MRRTLFVLALFVATTGLTAQGVAAQALTAPRYHGARPILCVKESFLSTPTRNCVYPDGSFGMWTDQDGGAVLLGYDDGAGLTWTDDGLYIFGLS